MSEHPCPKCGCRNYLSEEDKQDGNQFRCPNCDRTLEVRLDRQDGEVWLLLLPEEDTA